MGFEAFGHTKMIHLLGNNDLQVWDFSLVDFGMTFPLNLDVILVT